MILGRLGMTVDECIRAYKKIAQQAFNPKQTSILPARPPDAFSTKALEAAIKQTVREFCVEVECVTHRRQGHSTVRTCPHYGQVMHKDVCSQITPIVYRRNVAETPYRSLNDYKRQRRYAANSLQNIRYIC